MSLNPSIQSGKFRPGREVSGRIYMDGEESQSLNTDQGSSDAPPGSRISRPSSHLSLNPSIQIRAVPTDVGRPGDLPTQLSVSIPQYRSGQFRPSLSTFLLSKGETVSIPQ